MKRILIFVFAAVKCEYMYRDKLSGSLHQFREPVAENFIMIISEANWGLNLYGVQFQANQQLKVKMNSSNIPSRHLPVQS